MARRPRSQPRRQAQALARRARPTARIRRSPPTTQPRRMTRRPRLMLPAPATAKQPRARHSLRLAGARVARLIARQDRPTQCALRRTPRLQLKETRPRRTPSRTPQRTDLRPRLARQTGMRQGPRTGMDKRRRSLRHRPRTRKQRRLIPEPPLALSQVVTVSARGRSRVPRPTLNGARHRNRLRANEAVWSDILCGRRVLAGTRTVGGPGRLDIRTRSR